MQTPVKKDLGDLVLYDSSCARCTILARRFAGIFGRRGFTFTPLQAPSMQARLRSRTIILFNPMDAAN